MNVSYLSLITCDCLWFVTQPVCNVNQTPMLKYNRFHKPLIVVVYRGFSATTTIEKVKSTRFYV